MEPRFGQDLRHVRVHTETRSAESADAVDAFAYTVGPHIVFGPGQYSPGTEHGRKLLAHELTHVLQEKGQSPRGVLRKAKSAASVTSLHIEDNLKKAVRGAGDLLDQKMNDREAAINQLIANVQKAIDKAKKSKNAKTQQASEDKLLVLQADLKKDLSTILTKDDSKWVLKAHCEQIRTADKALKAKEAKVIAADVAWHKYDAEFDAAVSQLPTGFTAADLKALIAQESGDLTITDTHGDIAGIAQMGAKEVTEVGGNPEDRKDPKKAIPLAAKVLKKKVSQLTAALSTALPSGDELKKFVFASYNAGASTIAEAARVADAKGKDPTAWDDLIAGGNNSPLHKGIVKRLPKSNPDKKYTETINYVQRILTRQ
jgi:hypothetical protein